MKKSLKIISGVVGALVLLIVIALVLPFLVDLNQFKPQIQKVVADSVNARLDFQSARLRILPGLGVVLKGVVIENSDKAFEGTRLFSVSEVFFQTELMPLLSKRFVGTVRIEKPEIVVARKGFKNNLTALAKPSAAPTEPQPAPAAEKPQDPQAQADMMKLIKESVLIESFSIQDASLKVVDLNGTTAKQPVVINDLDLRITNIGLDRDIRTELTTSTQVNEAGIKVAGPISLVLIDRITMGGAGLENATFDGKLSFDDLEINALGAFVKNRGIPLNVTFKGSATTKSLLVEDLQVRLHNLAVGAKIDVKDLTTLLTEATATVKNDDLERLGDVLPQHKNLLVKGSIDLDASIKGPLAQPANVAGKLALQSRLTGSDIAVNVDLQSIEPLKVQADIASQMLDLGAILKPFMPQETANEAKAAEEKAVAEKTVATEKTAGEKNATAANQAPEKDFELTPEQKQMLKGADVKLKLTMKEFLFAPIKLEGFLLDLQQSGLRAQLNQFAVDGFGGQVRAKGLVNLEPSPIAFEQNFQINGVKAEEFMALIKPEHKDLLMGKLTIQLDARGTGTTRTTLSKTLNGKGRFKLEDGELHTPSVAAAMQGEFDKFVGGQSIVGAADKAFADAEKILANPLLKKIPGGKVPTLDLNQYKAKYATFKNVSIADKAAVDKAMKNVEGELEIKDGRIYITSKNAMGSGLFDFNGSVGLDMTLGGGAVFTGSDALKANMLKQSQYASLLFDDKQNFSLKMMLSGLVTDPKVQLDLATMKNNFTTKARTLVETEVKKAAEDQLKKSLGSSKEALVQQLKEKQAELKQKAKDEAKKKVEAEAKKKGGDKAKEKLKGLFGR